MKKQQYYYKTSMFEEIKERKEVLEKIIIEKRDALAKAPEGDVRANYDKARNVLQFYLRSEQSDKNGKYMKNAVYVMIINTMEQVVCLWQLSTERIIIIRKLKSIT